MAYPFDPTQHPLNSKPSPALASAADWRFWVNGLTWFERGQLYPGLQPETIVSVEMNRAQQNGPGSGLGGGAQSGYNALPTSPVNNSWDSFRASPSTNTQGLPSFGAGSTSGPGTLTPMGSPARPAPFAPFGTSPAPTSLAPASSSYKPYTPYVPYTPPAPWQPPLAQVAPAALATPATPMTPLAPAAPARNAFFSAPHGTLSGTPFGAPPAPIPVAPPVIPPFAPQVAPATAPPLNPAATRIPPLALPQFPFTATKPTLPPLPPGVTWRPMGLLDFSYVRRPETGNTSKTGTTARNAQYGRASNAWDRFTEFVEDAWEATEEGRRFATELASDFMEAPREEQIRFLVGLGDLLAEFNVAYGTAKDIKRLVERPELRTPAAIFGIIIGILPLFRSVRVGRKITAFIKHNAAKLKSAKAARKQGGKRPADAPDNPVPDGHYMTASGEQMERVRKIVSSPEFQTRCGEIIKGAVSGFIVEAIEQSLQKDPNYFLPFVQGVSGGATGAISGIPDKNGSKMARRWGFETMNSIITRLSKMALSSQKITINHILFGLGEERGVALLTDAMEAGYRLGLERASQKLIWNRSLTNLLKQAGPPVIKFIIELFAARALGLGDEPELVETLQEMLE